MQPTNAQIDAAVAILKLNPQPSSWEANARRLLEGLKLCRVQAETEPLGALKSEVVSDRSAAQREATNNS
jgi:hypothetical protein